MPEAKKPKKPRTKSKPPSTSIVEVTAADRQANAQVILDEITQEVGGGPSDPAKLERNLTIMRMHLRSVDKYDIGQLYGLHPETVRRIIAEMRRETQRLSKADPLEVVEEITMQIDAGISEIASIATKEKGSVRVTAVLGRINALIAKGRWLQSSGILPEKPSEMRLTIDTDAMMETVLDLLDERKVLSPELLNDIHKALGKGDIIDATAEEVT